MDDIKKYITYRTLCAIPEECLQRYRTMAEDANQKTRNDIPADEEKSAGSELWLTFMEAVHGVEKDVVLNVNQFCRKCDSHGRYGDGICPYCGGIKKIVQQRVFRVNVPAGIADGQKVALLNGAVKVHVEKHPLFERRKYDVYSTEFYPAGDYAVGSILSIDTLDSEPYDCVMTKDVRDCNPYYYAITKNTQDGQVLRLMGRGIPHLEDSSVRGDHYVTLRQRPQIHKNQEYWLIAMKNNLMVSAAENQEMLETGHKLIAIGDYKAGYQLVKFAAKHIESEQVDTQIEKQNTKKIETLRNPVVHRKIVGLGTQSVTWDVICFGTYPQNYQNGRYANDPIRWRILHIEDGVALLFADRILDAIPYQEGERNVVSWEKSSIRRWLNGQFCQIAFSEEERSALLYQDDSWDKISLLSADAILSGIPQGGYGFHDLYHADYLYVEEETPNNYTDYAGSKELYRKRMYPGRVASWWLKDTTRSGAMEVNASGYINQHGVNADSKWIGVRPVILVDLKKLRVPLQIESPVTAVRR